MRTMSYIEQKLIIKV